MPSLDPLLNHVGPFLLVLFRMSGLLVFSPVLSSSLLPLRLRALLTFAFALAVYPALGRVNHTPVSTDLMSLAPAIFGETLIGAALGLMAALPMYAVQLGGLVMGQQAGMSLGQVYNPALDVETDTLGQFLQYGALVLFIMMGGLEAIFVALANTFANVPIMHAGVGGGGGGFAPVALLSGLIASGFELALRVSSPVLCIILIETIATALLARTIPQINVQSLGFSIKVVITMVALAAGVAGIMHATGRSTMETINAAVRWTESLGR
ncbi:MAG TPA: flagellar biosynthetic protein FliR [Phycisphaerales bacterium]|nr:flagellar biosynthetic protein FliR [Phycisphaerales bacterium]